MYFKLVEIIFAIAPFSDSVSTNAYVAIIQFKTNVFQKLVEKHRAIA
ncbi:MAG: hypothetical protein F6K08_14850 [Okeania sp. SIO1H6]|nr:hypothetical protein [Okeania sp. SIO1H6]